MPKQLILRRIFHPRRGGSKIQQSTESGKHFDTKGLFSIQHNINNVYI